MRRRYTFLILLLAGCSTPLGNDIFLPVDDATTSDNDVAATLDGVAPDLLVQSDFGPFPGDLTVELQTEDTPFVPGCEPGEGCFLDPCTQNTDCQSGWCVEHLGEGVCSALCQEECPPGWACKPVGAGGPDLAYVCVSQYSNLCKPCATSEGCKSPGGSQDACLDYGDEGNFCGGGCTDDDDCPWGFSCTQSDTVDGVQLNQCTADAGVCPCASKSAALGLSTPCARANEFGTCAGKRICTEEGLSACDAATPEVETCDGLDNDCDGEVDEPVLVESDYVPVCDDGNSCTKDSCGGADGCSHTPMDEGECADGDACTVGDHCEAGICLGSPVACDDDNPCTDDVCDGLGGCKFTANSKACDDQNPCTVADQCKASKCVGTPVDCACQQNSDCGQLEDGNLCNGTLICDQSAFPYQCKVAPATIVTCPEPEEGPDAFCLQAECNPASGSCALIPAFEGFACNDHDACTIGDTCVQGSCAPGVAPLCADNNPCTDDHCDSDTGCQFVPNQAPCNDGDVCTTADTCTNALCLGGAPLDCDDANPCTDDACDAVKGCTHMANQAACSDGNACTKDDQCSLGACLPGPPLECDDGNQCTKDICLKESGCFSSFIDAPCDDGDACTKGEHCINGKCLNGQAVNCDDGNPCTDDACGNDGVCVHTANDAPCDDGNACTAMDHCSQGKCVYSGATDCDDQNLCTTDSCVPESGCSYKMNALACNDGDACTTGDVCSQGQCTAPALVDCDDNNVCTDDTCDAIEGCHHTDNNAPCDDNNACTIGDKCSQGACGYSGLANCDDLNVCTNDVCDPKLGCVHLHNNAPCEDGSVCTFFDTCQQGICVPGKDVSCDDDNLCTDDACDPDQGCLFVPNTAPCSDGTVCTVDDQCNGGICEAGAPLDCDDQNVCTDETCHPMDGCLHAPNDSNCDDQNACTTDTCDAQDGCLHAPIDADCDDSNACTEDTCDVDTGCVNTPIDDSCDDSVDCTVDTCDKDQGCVYTVDHAACDDNISCTVDLCDAQLGCVHLPTDNLCNDNNPCTTDTCSVDNDCVFANNNLACDDGKACTTNDVCSGGTCAGTDPKVKIYDSTLGVVTMLSCGGGHDGFNFVCNYKGYGAATGVHPTGDYQSGGPCWAIGEADGHINGSYGSCGSGCTHYAYVECYTCK
jgi:hypothetical protein